MRSNNNNNNNRKKPTSYHYVNELVRDLSFDTLEAADDQFAMIGDIVNDMSYDSTAMSSTNDVDVEEEEIDHQEAETNSIVYFLSESQAMQTVAKGILNNGKKEVSFSDSSTLVVIPQRNNNNNLWYRDKDYQRMQYQMLMTAREIHYGKYHGDNNSQHCVRGLEHKLPTASSFRFQQRKQKALRAVLDHQYEYRQQTGQAQVDATELANVYQEANRSSVQYARLMGLYDAREAQLMQTNQESLTATLCRLWYTEDDVEQDEHDLRVFGKRRKKEKPQKLKLKI
eukprot:CAMPEP_0178925184 /NCGR_PEP_ID=MMETSP0786-20121207/17762_1 /TAXON_ID=186022 /ORGANISM="Thalassionema frauenfeldii, Strain CCMP 1798" /LENGTH=283 /DNA_ID=CAMNT_0020600019 /DNA_START=281 /DNA_END=1129 /DNA_ORIENTATION=-